MPPPVNLYAGTLGPALTPGVADIPVRVYVPNSGDGTVSVIDPTTFRSSTASPWAGCPTT